MRNFPDWTSPEIVQNPYPIYEELRKDGPFYWDERNQYWTVLGYEDASSILRDNKIFTVSRISIYQEALKDASTEITDFLNSAKKWLIFQDGKEHERTRAPLVKALGASAAKSWKSTITSDIDGLLDGMIAQKNFDFVSGLAYPLPMKVISAMLGLAPAMSAELKMLTTKLVKFIDQSTVPEIVKEAAQANRRLFELFAPIVLERRQSPGDDLVSILIKLQVEYPDYSDDDILLNMFLLMGAGHETTTSLLANGLAALLKHGDQVKALQANPSLITLAVEEMLRFDPPVHRVGRLVTQDINFNGHKLKRGDRVIIYLAAANRDAACVDNPENFDIRRIKTRHLSFSGGNHFCAGAQFARLEAQLGIQRLLERFPKIQLGPGALSYLDNFTFHCLTRLPLVLE